MSAPPLFPTLRGLGWSTYKRPTHSTLVSDHASGDDVTATCQAYPRYEFELVHPTLPDSPAPGSDLKTLMGFYNVCHGRLNPFRYMDPSDCQISGQLLGRGDGKTSVFTFLRTLGLAEPVGWVEAVNRITVGGVDQATGWTVADSRTGHNALTFAVAPAAGQQITADFSFSFLAKFSDDQVEFEQQLRNAWLAKSIKFKSVKRL